MKIGRRTGQLLAVASLVVTGGIVAHADTISMITTNPGGDTVAWGTFTDGTTIYESGINKNNQFLSSPTSDQVTVNFGAGDGTGTDVTNNTSGTSWNSAFFGPNMRLLDTVNGVGTITLNFSTAVSDVFFGVQDFADQGNGGDNTTVVLYINGNSGTTWSFGPANTGQNVGLHDATGFGISSVTIDVTDLTTAPDNHFFAVGTANIVAPTSSGPAPSGPGPSTGGTVPEPGSIGLVATGVAALFWKITSRKKA